MSRSHFCGLDESQNGYRPPRLQRNSITSISNKSIIAPPAPMLFPRLRSCLSSLHSLRLSVHKTAQTSRQALLRNNDRSMRRASAIVPGRAQQCSNVTRPSSPFQLPEGFFAETYVSRPYILLSLGPSSETAGAGGHKPDSDQYMRSFRTSAVRGDLHSSSLYLPPCTSLSCCLLITPVDVHTVERFLVPTTPVIQ